MSISHLDAGYATNTGIFIGIALKPKKQIPRILEKRSEMLGVLKKLAQEEDRLGKQILRGNPTILKPKTNSKL